MKRVAVGLVALAAGIGAVIAGVPVAARAALAGHDATVGKVGWCAPGLCLTDLSVRGVTVRHAELRWDRSVALADATVDVGSLGPRGGGGAGEGGGASGGSSGGSPSVPGWVRSVSVQGLVVTGAPVPVAPLGGELWPERHLVGDGVEIDGDVVRAELEGPLGAMTVEATPAGDGLDVRATCLRCAWASESLGPAPLRLDGATVEGHLVGDTVTGTARVGEVSARVEAHRAGDGLTARVTLSDVPLAAVYTLLGPVVPEARRARIGGTVSGDVDLAWPDVGVRAHPTLDGFEVSGIVPPSYAAGPFTWPARDAAGAATLRTGGEGSAGWTPLAELGRALPMAVIAAEDARFLEHPGYDLDGMLAAAADNEARGETWRGGSTLTQQLAKNLFLDGRRTYGRKLSELLYAVELERTLGKRRILELYLNVVEWGPGIYGARAAAEAYFLKKPAGLLPEEAAWLASILPRPRSAYSSEYLRDRPHTERVAQILDSMRGLEDAERAAAKGRRLRFVPP